MRYIELHSSFEIKNIIDSLKREYGNLSKILVPSSTESTIKGSKILTIYRNLDPVMKIEVDDDKVLGQFIDRLNMEKQGY